MNLSMKFKTVLLLLMISSSAMAQKIKFKSGDLKFLKGETELNVEFDYSELKLLKENYTEEEYVQKRSKDLNDKTRGNGDLWKKKWEGSKETIWNVKFLEIMNTVLRKEKKDVLVQENLANAKYTLIVKAVWIYPGWDAGIMKQPAKVTTELTFVETADKSKVLAKIDSKEAPGDQWGSNFSNESRIGEGFAKTAKTLAKVIVKQNKR